MRVTADHTAVLNARLSDRSALGLLRFVHEHFGERAAILSSMQRAGTILCHLADRAGLPFDVLFVDTGLLHVETRCTRDALVASHPNLRIITLKPERSFAEQTATEGLLYLSKPGQERCCELRKMAPLKALVGRYDVLISALRREEGGSRAKVEPFGLDPETNALRAHPLWSMSREELETYPQRHPDVIVNPLHKMGFPTIGCFPCTTPVLPDEPERAGRWRHLASVTYCGINPVDRADSRTIELPDVYAPLFGERTQL